MRLDPDRRWREPAYVQRLLGHSSIKLTVDLYGKWLPIANKAPVDRLAGAAPGEEVVADAVANGPERAASGERGSVFPRGYGGRAGGYPPKSFLSESRKPPTRGPSASSDDTRWNSSRSSRCRAVSTFGTSTTTA